MKKSSTITLSGQMSTVNTDTSTHTTAPRVAPIMGIRPAIATLAASGSANGTPTSCGQTKEATPAHSEMMMFPIM
jgi:hypothetical protein